MQTTQTAATGTRLIFVPFIGAFGGVERLLVSLSRSLSARAVTHAVACFRNTIDFQRYAGWRIPLHEIPATRTWLAETRALRRWLRSPIADDFRGPALVFDLKGAFYAGLSMTEYVLHLTDPPSLLDADVSKHAPSQSGGRRLKALRKLPLSARAEAVHRLNRRAARRAGSVVVMTNVIAAEVRQRYGISPKVIRPGVARPPQQPVPLGERSRRGLRLLTISRLESNKRLEWILHSMADIRSCSERVSGANEWSLDIVGTGPSRQSLLDLIESLGLSDRAFLRGSLSDSELETFYDKASMFIVPGAQGYGLPALEALVRQIPVIIHAQSGVSEILHGSPWVEIIRGNDGSDLPRAIETIAQRLASNALSPDSLPNIPTDDGWTAEICQQCGWL